MYMYQGEIGQNLNWFKSYDTLMGAITMILFSTYTGPVYLCIAVLYIYEFYDECRFWTD